MRHGKHNHILGVKKEHRRALLANLAAALIEHGRIETTLAKAKALRPFIEKIITLAKKAHQTEIVEQKLHFRRLAIARVRDVYAIHRLFDEKVSEFLKRVGGYVRIYKLVPRQGDAAKMAIIEFVAADDTGYKKSRKKRAKRVQKAPVEELVTQEA
ncbi:MAG: 50S ribosomal protein L17 [Puniceicoccales bacterium]|jgi:large subunit ribosomal protein L17|nr:50S ribosomal protein L17 [Puniceicoccales bacterium]